MARVESVVSPTAISSVSLRRTVSAYIALTKPRIIVLLVITTVPAMMLADAGIPPMLLIFATVFGGILTAGCANALNQILEIDLDSAMDRTKTRPLPSHRVDKPAAAGFALTIGALGTALLWVIANPLAAMLAVSAIVFYVGVYTLLLKRRTPQNIVIGGAAGAVPALVGWAAVAGDLSVSAWMMFAIIFLWTPPHFWALALKYSDDYKAASIPMMPVVKGVRRTVIEIVVYSFAVVAAAISLTFLGGLGSIYLATSAVLGVEFIRRALVLLKRPEKSMALFGFSIVYLALVFGAIAVDAVL